MNVTEDLEAEGRKQILYALDRQISYLDKQAHARMQAQDYDCMFFEADADALRKAKQFIAENPPNCELSGYKEVAPTGPAKEIQYLEIPDFLRRQDLAAEQIAQLQREHLALTKRNTELEAEAGRHDAAKCVAEDKVNRLVEHSAVLAVDLIGNGDCVDASNDSWRSLPPDLQEEINKAEKRLSEEKQL